jgi:beta-glucosidase
MTTTTDSPFSAAAARVAKGASPADEAAALYSLLTPDERLGLLEGDAPFWTGMGEMLLTGYNLDPIPMGQVDRIGLPGVQFADGPRGCVVGEATAFPVPTGRAATFDVELEERVGQVIGREARAQGANYFGGVCINLPRHPAWGRSQESYGEEPGLLGEMGAALTRGTRAYVMACAKHFALNSMENARFSVDVSIDDADLHEYFLPHFKRVVGEGVDSIMSSYNSVNGEWAGQNKELLTDILRGDWGFEGFVLSDFIWGSRDAGLSLRNGLDVEAPFAQQRSRGLRAAIDTGVASLGDVERAGLRIIGRQLALYARTQDLELDPSVVASAEHRALARETAVRSMVLVRNEPVGGAPLLPLDRADIATMAVVGRLADLPNTGDHGSSDVRAPEVVTAAEGLALTFPQSIVSVDSSGDPAASAALAGTSDVAVVVVGYTAAEEGEFVGGEIFSRDDLNALYPEPTSEAELAIQKQLVDSAASGRSVVGAETAGGDRRDVRLSREDVALIKAVARANPRTVVVIVAGGTVVVDEWIEDVPAAAFMWYAGMEGGLALGDLLSGDRDFSGRLPFAVPTSIDHLPDFDINATAVTYDGSFGQRRLEQQGHTPRFPFGYGLGYADTSIVTASAVRDMDKAIVTVTVANHSEHDARHVVQLYASREDGLTFLVGFASVEVPAGGSATADVVARLEYAGRWDGARRAVVAPAGPVEISVASHWSDPDALIVSA